MVLNKGGINKLLKDDERTAYTPPIIAKKAPVKSLTAAKPVPVNVSAPVKAPLKMPVNTIVGSKPPVVPAKPPVTAPAKSVATVTGGAVLKTAVKAVVVNPTPPTQSQTKIDNMANVYTWNDNPNNVAGPAVTVTAKAKKLISNKSFVLFAFIVSIFSLHKACSK